MVWCVEKKTKTVKTSHYTRRVDNSTDCYVPSNHSVLLLDRPYPYQFTIHFYTFFNFQLSTGQHCPIFHKTINLNVLCPRWRRCQSWIFNIISRLTSTKCWFIAFYVVLEIIIIIFADLYFFTTFACGRTNCYVLRSCW